MKYMITGSSLLSLLSSVTFVGCGTESSSTIKKVEVSPAGVRDILSCTPGRVTDGPDGSKFSCIPPGTFMMGSPSREPGRDSDEGPQHQVTISKAFELQTTEVTQYLWVSVMGSNPSYSKKSEKCPGDFSTVNNIALCPNNPVEQVSWNDAQLFIDKLNSKTDGYRYGLPTEAEWEYAARAGTTGRYAGYLDGMAWCGKISDNGSHPVGKKRANAWGLYDMHGNVWEWTSDWYGSYSASQVTDPAGPSSGSFRVLRGGSWLATAPGCRSASRSFDSPGPGSRSFFTGLRLLRTRS
jgi:formylglycine-generating enzyme required for sulfatase activity